MKTAVIRTGGKQYVVQEGVTIKVEKLALAAGDAATFTDVLLTATEKATRLGTPHIAGARVEAKVVKVGKADKVIGVKLKPKKRYRRYFGHRQPYTEVQITAIKTSSRTAKKSG